MVELPSSSRLAESKAYQDIYWIIGVGAGGMAVCVCVAFSVLLCFRLSLLTLFPVTT